MLPDASIWSNPNFQVAGLIMVVLALVYTAAKSFWADWRKYQDAENKRREEERERQRLWQAEQNRLRENDQNGRDGLWRDYLEQLEERQRELIAMLQERQSKDTRATNEILSKLVERMDAMTNTLNSHDQYARIAIEAARDQIRKA